MPDFSLLRSTFNTVARAYDAIRPGYPAALIEDLIALADLPAGRSANLIEKEYLAVLNIARTKGG